MSFSLAWADSSLPRETEWLSRGMLVEESQGAKCQKLDECKGARMHFEHQPWQPRSLRDRKRTHLQARLTKRYGRVPAVAIYRVEFGFEDSLQLVLLVGRAM